MKFMRNNQQGFTIIELMVATAVFSVVLLLCTYGLLAIGRTYYKGATISRTQEAARIIVDDISEAIRFNGGNVHDSEANSWHCVGTKRYSFAINRQLSDSNHALVSDTISSCGPGTGRQAEIDGGALSASSQELLGNRMRLMRFSLEDIGDNLYRITVRVATGEDDLFEDLINNTTGAPGGDGQPDTCKNERSGSHFCAVSELTTVVQKRV